MTEKETAPENEIIAIAEGAKGVGEIHSAVRAKTAIESCFSG
jgi:hypothetical protein